MQFGLILIVKNESKIIKRCLDSCKFVDYVVITDTGSTDDTESVINKWIIDNGKLGKVYHEEFSDYGTCRTHSYQNMICWLNMIGVDRTNVMILTIDADQWFVENGLKSFFESTEDRYVGYKMELRHGSVRYPNIRVFWGKYDWVCIRRCHEVWRPVIDALEGGDSFIPSKYIYTDDYDDGGNKGTKYIRENALLELDAKEFDDARSYFYLGQGHRGSGYMKKAIECYRKCIERSKWNEEIWYSWYAIGMCYSSFNTDKAVSSFLTAYEFDKSRLESLYRITKIYREKRMWNVARLYIPDKIEIPENRLFLELDVYQWRFDEELSIIGYYLGINCMDQCEKLILTRGVNGLCRQQARANSLYYLEKLEGKIESIGDYVCEEYSLDRSMIGIMNPGMCRIDPDTLLINVRVVNYHIVEGRYVIHGSDYVITRNFLLCCNIIGDKLEIINSCEIVLDSKIVGRNRGLEDIRLVCNRNKIFLSCTTWELEEDQDYPLIGWGKFNKNMLADNIIKIKLNRINYGKLCEKNWMPFYHDGLKFVYDCGPETVIIDRFGCELSRHGNIKDLRDFRGGALCKAYLYTEYMKPVSCDLGDNGNGYLGIIHEVLPIEGPRVYTHRFLIMDNKHNITKFSRPFIFDHKGIEFCCGIEIIGDNVVCSFGIDDNSAFIVRTPVETVLRMLN